MSVLHAKMMLLVFQN